MHTRLFLVRSFCLLSVSTIFPLLFAGALRGQTTQTEIDYTGSLMGYYRIEATETAPVLQPVRDFLKFRDDEAQDPKDRRLLLGMGDDFGPEFGAALQFENIGLGDCKLPQKTGLPDNDGPPESLYKDDDRIARAAYCDNVLNFLMTAGFRAVVPGREDFMYSAGWLRGVARLLAEESERENPSGQSEAGKQNQATNSLRIENEDHRLFLLAANLRMALTAKLKLLPNDGPGSAYGLKNNCPLLFAGNPFARGSVKCVNQGSGAGGGGSAGTAPEVEPLDWLDRLDRLSSERGKNPAVTAMRQLAAGTTNVRNALVSDEVAIMQAAWWSPQAFKSADKIQLPALPGKFAFGGHESGSPDLDPDLITSLSAILHSLDSSVCQAGAVFNDPANRDNARDLCAYRDRLLLILLNLKDNLAKPGEPLENCTADNGDSSAGACFLLSEASRKAAIRGLLRTIAREQKDVGYTVAEENGQKILVIGVVGQDTMEAVSETNLRLCIGGKGSQDLPNEALNGKNWPKDFGRCDDAVPAAEVVVTDPTVVTGALVRGASLEYGSFDAVVVMAQMTHTEAEVLATRVWAKLRSAGERPVDLVLSEPEAGYDTPALELSYALPAQRTASAGQANPAGAQGSSARAQATTNPAQAAASANAAYPAPVLTPVKGYSSSVGYSSFGNQFPGTVSRVTLVSPSGSSGPKIDNSKSTFVPKPADNRITAVSLLFDLIHKLRGDQASPIVAAGADAEIENENRAELMLLQYLEKASQPTSDLVLLESRDMQLDTIGQQAVLDSNGKPAPLDDFGRQVVSDANGRQAPVNDYADYGMCPVSPERQKNICMLRIALDRILWKGDYMENVAVTGKDLQAMLAASEQLIEQQSDLADRDITKEWLASYGIVQASLSNLTEVNRNNEPLWVPVDPSCTPSPTARSTYCIDGTPIADDAYYWLLTTDQMAQDKLVYGALQKLPQAYHQTSRYFVTHRLSHFLIDRLQDPDVEIALTGQAKGQPRPVEETVTASNERFQQLPIWQVDFTKLVAGFTSRQPVGGNAQSQNFQGVSDSRASVPTQQELDLELASRVTGSFFGPAGSGKSFAPISFGIQSAFAYDRSVIGNLTNRPINASYSLNNITEAGFIQVRLGGKSGDSVRGVHSLPRALLVFTPRQYQLEIDNPYLFFSFAAGSAVPGELTVKLPRISAWTDRGGLRAEFAGNRPRSFSWFWLSGGSYLETGMEFSTQNNVLSALTLQDTNQTTGATTTHTCQVTANVTLQTCFTSARFAINNTTTVVGLPAVKTLHSPGYYWDFHSQNHLWPRGGGSGPGPGKQWSLVTDSQGDYYFGRSPSAELPTQTEYAIPLSLSLVIPAYGNLSFAPTYSGFFYKSQLSAQSLQVNSFSITARWYFARNARVPVRRQTPLPGPASADQTHTGKGH